MAGKGTDSRTEDPPQQSEVSGAETSNGSRSAIFDFARNLLAKHPESEVFAVLAEEFCSRNLWQEAIETCRRGLAFHPNHLKGRVILGRALWEIGEIEESERVLQEVRREFEENVSLYKILADIAERKGDSQQAAHLLAIFNRFHGESKETVSVEKEPQASAQARKETDKGQKAASILHTFLLKLSSRYEEKRSAEDGRLAIFTDMDRTTLRQIICQGLSQE